MIGAIIGDIVGSRFEFNNHRSKDFVLFTKDCMVTDDSIMTLAVAKAIMAAEQSKAAHAAIEIEYLAELGKLTVQQMQKIGRKYPDCGYGGMFARWVFSSNPQPYNSFGNGAAMRISPVGFFAKSAEEVRKLSNVITGVTHNHKEGLKGAEATAMAIFLARQGCTKPEIRHRIQRDYYPLNFKINDIRATYKFNETCQDTVPQAIQAFLESESFEDAIRTAISVGGDSDTLAAITGGIAEAYYGVPDHFKEKALSYLDDELRTIYDEWRVFLGQDATEPRFKVLTKYIDKLEQEQSYGKWVVDEKNDGTFEHPIQMPFVDYSRLVMDFEDDFKGFMHDHQEYELNHYYTILEKNGLAWGQESMRSANVDDLDAQCVLALITGAIRAEHFSGGALLSFFEEGLMLKWLKRLRTLDRQ
jgi:ADP-ribosyl-[dinitrogen reductase] hydrolase